MKKTRRFIFIPVLVLLLAAVLGLARFMNYGPKPAEIIHRLKPVIVDKPSVKAVVVEAKGDPKTRFKTVFGLLMSTYFKIKNVPKGRTMEAPRARWPKPFDTPKDEWVGIYAIPVPPSVTALPKIKVPDGLTITLTEWHYGTVAEILHIGPYGSEDTTVAKLHTFITENGYEICGAHEEEYLKGPGFLPGNSANYLTIIRYQVKRH